MPRYDNGTIQSHKTELKLTTQNLIVMSCWKIEFEVKCIVANTTPAWFYNAL